MTLARRVAANAATALGLQSGVMLLGLAATAVFVRALGLERYGAWAVLTAVVAYGGILELGLGVSLVRRVAALHAAGDHGALALAVGGTVTATSVLGILGAVVVFVAAGPIAAAIHVPSYLGAEFVAALRVSAVAVWFAVPSAALGAVPTALQRLDAVVALEAAVTSGVLAVQIGVALGGGDLVGLAVVMVLGRVVSLAGRALLARRLLGRLTLRVNLRYPFWAELGRFGALKVVHQLASLLVQHLDRLLVALFLSAGTVAYYAVPLDLAQRLLFVQSNVSLAFYPAACAAAAPSERSTFYFLYERTSRAVAVATFPLAMVLVVFAGPILSLWVGPAVAARSADLLRVLAAAYALMALTAIPSNAADALNRPEISARYSIAGLAINVTLALILIPRLGIIGSGLAILGNVVLQAPWFVRAVTRTIVGAPLWPYALRAIGQPLVPAAIAGAVLVGAVATGLARGPAGLAFAALAGGAAFLVAVRWIGLFNVAEGEVLAELPGGRLLRWLAGSR
ncbi:MAG: polysaccharide biosynthesis C-terminal domain-containing protein [Gemmatimonadales bacterium]|nr:polysaccharide biosynthesis C-terminal domain-containing protein [Gemmatimonadales bacterium]